MEINNFEKLVHVVTTNVLQKIDPKTDFKTQGKSCLILLPNICFGIKDYLEYIEKKFPGYALYLSSEEDRCSQLDDIKSKNNIYLIKYGIESKDFINLINSVEVIIILGLKISQMRSLAKVDDSESINHIILGRLMTNKTVNIMMNADGLILNKILDVISEIKQMGIDVINIKQNSDSVKEKVDLITENYVVHLKKAGIKALVLDKKQLITPLAKDKLREYKIGFSYTEEEKK
jgi:hypothetical protein